MFFYSILKTIFVLNKKQIIMKTHNINYDGVDYEVTGEWDSEDKATGYKGGFSWMQIHINGMDMSQHLNNNTIERLQELVVEENY